MPNISCNYAIAIALSVLTACGGGGGGSGDGGSTSPSLVPPSLPITFSDSSTGGAGRTLQAQVDGMPVIISVIADSDFSAMLDDPSRTNILADDNTLQFASNGTATSIVVANTLPKDRFAIALDGRPLGTRYFLRDANGSAIPTVVYIDAHAATMLSYDFIGNTTSEAQVVAIGGHAPSTLPTGTARYAGYAAAMKRETGVGLIGFGDPFTMEVDFSAGRVTAFTAELDHGDFAPAPHGNFGTVTTDAVGDFPAATDIRIDARDGTFTGSINFRGSPVAFLFGPLIPADSSGTIYGQFHGEGAEGVTGLFHNTANSVLGGFAGSKQP